MRVCRSEVRRERWTLSLSEGEFSIAWLFITLEPKIRARRRGYKEEFSRQDEVGNCYHLCNILPRKERMNENF